MPARSSIVTPGRPFSWSGWKFEDAASRVDLRYARVLTRVEQDNSLRPPPGFRTPGPRSSDARYWIAHRPEFMDLANAAGG